MVDASQLRRAIHSAGYRSQAEFALAVGLSAPKLSLIMSGRRGVKAPEVSRMSSALRLPPDALLGILAPSRGAERPEAA
jgi:transcriptional regulator with XRE-family HTH domain